MTIPQFLLFTVYYALLAVVGTLLLFRGLMVWRWFRRPKGDEAPLARFDDPPVVTVQLPVYNEPAVVERLLEAVCALRWPRDRLEVQLLDDSTDSTSAVAARRIERLREQGFDVVHVRRGSRAGYKAGALAAGMEIARGEFLAVFDADFLPRPDFLENTIHHFTDATVAFVQTRWTHLNEEHGPLTRGLALLLDGHFVVEQATRARTGYAFPFNGTGGVWRRGAIRAAGGWRADTICEDTDLAFRAQLAGWRGVYLSEVTCPCELPADPVAVKTQQHRWAKGLTECVRSLAPTILRAPIPRRHKIDALLYLGANLAYPASLFLTVVSLPVMLLRRAGVGNGLAASLVDQLLFALVIVSQIGFYAVALFALHPKDWRRRILWLPVCPILGVGLLVNNARGVLEALLGHRSEFVRTPKVGMIGRGGATAKPAASGLSRAAAEWLQPVLEVALAIAFADMALLQVRFGLVGPALMPAAFSLGLFGIGLATIRQLTARAPATAHVGGRAPAEVEGAQGAAGVTG